jgi:hypothetical protein
LFDRRTLLTHYWLPIATSEDEWDELLEDELGLEEDGEQRWVDPFNDSLADNAAVYDAQLKKTAQIARRMLKIVDLETELALKEGQRIRGRHKPRKKT